MPTEPKREQARAHTCEQCGKGFYSSRYDARLCSAACRKVRQRALQRDRRAAANLIVDLERFIDQSCRKRGAATTATHDALVKIARMAQSAADVW